MDPLSPLHDPVDRAAYDTPSPTPTASAWADAEPFAGWGSRGGGGSSDGHSAQHTWGDAADERGDGNSEVGVAAAASEADEESASPTSSIPPPSPTMSPSDSSPPLPGTDPSSSVTPRQNDSPLSRKANLDTTPVPSSSPSTFSPLRAPPIERTPSRASSSRGYEPTVLRNLIASAASNGDLERLQHLIATNSSAEESGEAGSSAFTLANQTSPHTGCAPLHYAAQRGHVDVVQWLVEEAGAMPELEDGEGETPAHKAAHRGHLDVCRFLISRGVDVDAQDADGWTALHNAASRGWLDIANLLVNAGASIDQPSKRAYTPLMNAASKGQLPLVHFLLKQGASPLLRNAYFETAYDLAAAVFETQICTVLAVAERAAYEGEDSAREPYSLLDLHSTVPVLLHENQRLALPTLKKLSSLASATGQPQWTAKALSRNDARGAFSMPPLPGSVGERKGEGELPCFRSEVGLPVVGKEGELVLPPRREIRSGGRVRVSPSPAVDESRKSTPRPSTSRRGSSNASSSLQAALASSSSTSHPEPTSSPFSSAAQGEPSWIWLSDWVPSTTSPLSSPFDGWSYAPSFSTPAAEWSASPPLEVLRAFEGGAGVSLALDGKKWVRRREWVRVMRRRVDLPDWGYLDLPPYPRRQSTTSPSVVETAATVAPAPPPSLDYRARAQFLAGVSNHPSTALSSDAASIRSSHTVTSPSVSDRSDLRKASLRLSRAADELRRGMQTDDDASNRRGAEEDLEKLLQQAALVRAELGGDELEEEGESDDEFVYPGGPEDDDARSVWTSAPGGGRRAESISSGDAGVPASSSSYFSQPLLPSSSWSSSPSRTRTDPSSSPYADLTPSLSRAPDFRIPTHETAAPSFRHPYANDGFTGGGGSGSGSAAGAPFAARPRRAKWEPDEEAGECRRCREKFSLFKRKHHCRRCGFVVCAACSPHSDPLDPYTVALEPGTFSDFSSLDGQPWGVAVAQYRTCTDCHNALSLPSGVGDSVGGAGAASLLSPQAFFPSSPSLGSVTPSEAAASDASELVECPVCGTTLAGVGGGTREEQEGHVRECLESGGGSVASGRYLSFTLPPDAPLIGEECRVCFEEFEQGDKMARLVCLCTFHAVCLSAWLSRGHSCPVHASRES